jgi:hypothetical protein
MIYSTNTWVYNEYAGIPSKKTYNVVHVKFSKKI